MLKVNENAFMKSIDRLSSCDKVLVSKEYELNDIRKQLCEIGGLDDEALRLGRIISEIELTDYRIKSMMKVLNFANIQYNSCEKQIADNGAEVATVSRNDTRLVAAKFRIPYLKLINWR